MLSERAQDSIDKVARVKDALASYPLLRGVEYLISVTGDVGEFDTIRVRLYNPESSERVRAGESLLVNAPE